MANLCVHADILIPRRQRQVLRLLAIVNSSLELDNNGVGGIWFATCGHGNRHDSENRIWRKKELLLPLHIGFFHQIYVLATVPDKVSHAPHVPGTHSLPERGLAARVDLNDPVNRRFFSVESHQPEPAVTH
jgi:hypothetical protein